MFLHNQDPKRTSLRAQHSSSALTRELRQRGVLVRQDNYVHPYPHCWRCDTPLVNKALSSWFVAVTKVKDRMLELNPRIVVPGHGNPVDAQFVREMVIPAGD